MTTPSGDLPVSDSINNRQHVVVFRGETQVSENQHNLLRLPDAEEGTEVRVKSTTASLDNQTHPAYVDADGIVRQEGNGAAFNGQSYEVVER